jgi:hypothetical protein
MSTVWYSEVSLWIVCRYQNSKGYLRVPSSTFLPLGKITVSPGYFGVPCSTMEYFGVLWSTMQYHGVLWSTMEYFGVPCSTMEYFRVPYDTMGYFGVP